MSGNSLNNNLFVSVVIPVFNAQESIVECLQSVLQQDYDQSRYEVLVVDNNSTDNTRSIIERMSSENGGRLKYLHEEKKGVCYARNRGIKEVKGDVVLFTDSDCVADRCWIKEIANVFIKYNADAVQGRIILSTEIPANTIFSKDFIEKRMASVDYADKIFEMSSQDLVGANMAVRTDVLKRLNGFNSSKNFHLCEDTEFSRRLTKLGFKKMYTPLAKIFHYFSINRINEKNFLKQSYVWGKANVLLEPVTIPKWKYFIYCIRQVLTAGLSSVINNIRGNKSEAFLAYCRVYGFLGRCNGLITLKENQ